MFYTRGLQDYNQAMFYDPFLKDVPERIADLEKYLQESSRPRAKTTFFASESKERPLPKREELTPQQRVELDQMKEKLRAQKPR
jgi:hypothetical protein